MKDRYLFRGKRIDNGEWEIGYLYCTPNHAYISNDYADMVEMDKDTICQCTGFKDGNDVLIFEKDIISTYVGDAIVVWSDGEWKVKFIKDNKFQKNLYYWVVEDCYMEEVRVIGDLIL